MQKLENQRGSNSILLMLWRFGTTGELWGPRDQRRPSESERLSAFRRRASSVTETFCLEVLFFFLALHLRKNEFELTHCGAYCSEHHASAHWTERSTLEFLLFETNYIAAFYRN